ncbi:MAG: LacI family DNA-binding transcriptional regulator [Streptococcus sp.]
MEYVCRKNITRKDVAEKAGVSVSVVSRVLNNSGYVDKKKRKIIKIAEQLGYIPNPIAMALQTRRTYQIIFFAMI